MLSSAQGPTGHTREYILVLKDYTQDERVGNCSFKGQTTIRCQSRSRLGVQRALHGRGSLEGLWEEVFEKSHPPHYLPHNVPHGPCSH